MIGATAKKFLVIEFASFSILATLLFAFMFLHSYTFHFGQVTLNYYTNGKVDFTTDASSLVRSLGTVAMLSLVFGVTLGAAVGLTCSLDFGTANSRPGSGNYEEEMARMGFVVITKTEEGTTYRLTDFGRRFLREYRFLEKTEQTLA
ncbi:MAG TPA: hypothetical protein VEG61_01805 [Candidatus Dormibacteraeota bacterium]|nr:hypothetical protein [Candidatus Dormibacteraeota bacterium]